MLAPARVLCWCGLLAASSMLRGQTTFPYPVNTGNYSTAATWNTNTVPALASNYPLISGNNTVTFQSGDTYSVGGLGIGHNSANNGTGTLAMTGGSLTVSGLGSFNIGESRGGTFNQSGGTLSVVGDFTLGRYYTTSGEAMTWSFTGGSTTITGNLAIGRFEQASTNASQTAAAATVSQTNANLTVSGNVVLGSTASDANSFIFSHTLGAGAQLTLAGVITTNTYGTRDFTFNGGTLVTTATHTSGGGLITNLNHLYIAAGGATVRTDGGNVTISQALLHSGSGTDGGLRKEGTHQLTLTQANTYNGSTVVAAGLLRASGAFSSSSSLGTGSVTVQNGATLAGNDFISGAVTVANGGQLKAETASELRFDAGLNLQLGSILDFQLGTSSGSLLVKSGTFSASGVTINFSNGGGFSAGTYYLVSFDPGFGGSHQFSAFSLGTTIDGYSYSLRDDPNSITLVVSAIPEPATVAFIAGLAGLGLALVRRRSRAGC